MTTTCTCLEDNKLSQAICPIHNPPRASLNNYEKEVYGFGIGGSESPRASKRVHSPICSFASDEAPCNCPRASDQFVKVEPDTFKDFNLEVRVKVEKEEEQHPQSEWETKIFNIIAKFDNGTHSANQLQGADEALRSLLHSRDEKLRERIEGMPIYLVDTRFNGDDPPKMEQALLVKEILKALN